jgi:CCCH-type zinc finger/IBR domain, a half RING-finger domain/Zinc finger C-x8-C-x5-C-x3-H type (and similar)
MTPCKFFAQGMCRNGDSCTFSHERNTSTSGWNQLEPGTSAFPVTGRLNINLAGATHLNRGVKPTRVCTFFMKGSCNKSDKCEYLHSPATVPPQQAYPDTISLHPHRGLQDELSPHSPSDSRAGVPYKFFSRAGGCRGGSCPYYHAASSHEAEKSGSQDLKVSEDEASDEQDQEHDDDFNRYLSGALVCFDEFGDILKVSLPTDFSLACITGLAPGTTPNALVDILRGFGFNLNIGCVRIPGHTVSSETKATVKVEDPLLAKELSARLKDHKSTLSAALIPIDARRTNCRKVYISWHKATQSVWVNFGNGDIANRVAQKFNEGRYKCLGQLVKSTTGRGAASRGGRGGLHNPLAWTIILSDVPSDATSKDVEEAIKWPQDKPRQVMMGSVSYRASNAEVSVEVRSRLEEYGRLESFYLAPTSKGKRVKATAWFEDEVDARSACSLNKEPLEILKNSKLTVTLIQSAKFKVSTAVYFASKARIDKESKIWRERHLALHIYPDTLQRFITLKVEGDDTKEIANARKTLEKILSGIVLTDGENAVWASALSSNGSAYRKLKSIEKDLHVVIVRDKSKGQLQFHGSSGKIQQAVRQISDMLREESSASYEIDLKPHQFSWAIHGGFKSIEQVLGKNVSVFDVVSKKITINGTQRQYETALAVMDGKRDVEIGSLSAPPSVPEGDCPICFCEAENPIQLSCKHIYCLDCFEECSKFAASTSNNKFQIKCPGNEGACSTIFPLRELKDHLSSSIFEIVLKSSFEQYIQRHPELFRYCPTPDCGYVYRCVVSGSKSLAYTCPSCFEPLCRSCHARHGEYTCSEYKDIASGGHEALARLKKELNIIDCPKCTTPMEKTEGCNHMTCGGCRAHICWVCMTVFKTSGPCYDHMNKEHGGFGLGLERFMDW